MSELNIKKNGQVYTLVLNGRLDAHTVAETETWLLAETESAPAFIILDMAATTFVDTRAVTVLVQAMKRARQLDGELALCALSQPVRVIVELMRLDRAFIIFEDEAAALADLSTRA